MRASHVFLIDSNGSEHRLSIDGSGIGTFPTLDAATSEAAGIARYFAPSATLSFELDFKWTLSGSEIREAVLESASHRENPDVDR